MQPCILIYRSELLAYSETFIAAQAGALRTFRPIFAGLRRVSNSLPLTGTSLPLTEGAGTLDRLRRYAFLRLGYAPRWLARLRAQAPVLVHAHFAPDAAEALPLLRSLGIPLIVTLHGYDVMARDAAHRRTPRGRVYLKRRAQLLREARLFLCVSHAVRNKAIERGFPPERLRVHPIGIDTAAHTLSPQLHCEPAILFVGRLVEKKGCMHLVRAMREVQRALPEARLIIIGDGPERARLESAARDWCQGTIFLGVLSPRQVQQWMAASRVLAVPSISARDGDAEGLPTVLGEALAVGLPVACFRSSGIPEMVRDGVEGLLAEEGDEAGLACNLLRLCQDDALAAQLRQAGRLRIEQNFELGTQTAALEAIYSEVLAQTQIQTQTQTQAQAGSQRPIFTRPEKGAVRPLRAHADLFDRPSTFPLPPKRPDGARARSPMSAPRLRHQAAWMISGNGVAVLFQALYFVLMGRMLGSREYGALVGVVALVNVLSQFSSLGMEMILLREVSRDRASFARNWAVALVVSGAGFLGLLLTATLYAHFFLPPLLRLLVPWIAVADGLLGKLTQLASRALQGADHAAWSARLTALTNAARTVVAAALMVSCLYLHRHASALAWVRVYWLASLAVALFSTALVTRTLGRPQFAGLTWRELRRSTSQGISFSLSSSAISVYNDIDKTLLVSLGQSYAAGIYAAAYRVIDVLTTPIYSLYAAATPQFFREGAQGVEQAARFSRRLLRWTLPFGGACALGLAVAAPLLPLAFGRSFAGSVTVLRWLCLLPLIRGMQYAWGTTITAASSQWLRTSTQAGAAILNLSLNLVLIPHWSWQGAAVASLLTDGALAASNGVLVAWLLRKRRASQAPASLIPGGVQQA